MMRRASSPRPRPAKPKPKRSPNKPTVPPAANDDPPPAPAGPAAVPAAAPAASPVPMKPEPADDKITTPARPRPPVVLPNPAEPWKHPDELEYIRPHSWSQSILIASLLDGAFSVPPRHPPGSADPWCALAGRDGSSTIVPKGYRLPLMFAMKFQWESLRLVLSSPQREDEWNDYKFDILHVSRLCSLFLKQAREAMANNGMDKAWRSPTFDRALTRYYRRWLVNREEFLMAFWKEFQEEEYEDDILKKDWTRFVLKGHKGFHLTKEECAQGLSYQILTAGLQQRSEDGRFYWVLPPASAAFQDTGTTTGKKSRKTTGKRKRGVDKGKDKGEGGKDEDKDEDKGKGREAGKEKEAEKGKERAAWKTLLIRGWKGTEASPPVVESDSPPAKKARVEEVTETETEQAASSSSPLGSSSQLSEVTSRAKENEEVKKVVKEKLEEKERGDEQEHPRRLVETEGTRSGKIVICTSPSALKVYLKYPRVSEDGDDEEEEKEEEEKEKGEEEKEEKGEEEKDEKEKEKDEKEKEKDEKEGKEKEKEEEKEEKKKGEEKKEKEKGEEDNAEKEKGPSDEDEDDMLLQAEGLRYPESELELMELDSQVPHDAVDKGEEKEKEKEKDDDTQKTVGASDAEPPPPPDAAVSEVTTDSVLAPATTSAATPPVDSLSGSNNTTLTASLPTARASTSTTTSTTNTNANTNASTKPASKPSSTTSHPPPIIPTFTLPASAPAPAQPAQPLPTPPNASHVHAPAQPTQPLPTPPDVTHGHPTSQTANADTNPQMGGRLSATTLGSSDTSGSAGPSNNANSAREDRDPSLPPPASTSVGAPVAEGSSKDAAREGGTSPEKRQSSWDARVSKALERARAIKASGPGAGAVTGGAGVWVPQRAAWYVPQVPQWDSKEKERVLQRTNTAGATGPVGSPVIPAAGRFPPVALSSGPSAPDSSSGSGSGSGASISATQPLLSSAPSVAESSPAPAPSPQPPIAAQSDNLTTTAVSLPPVSETMLENHETDTPPAEPNSEVTPGPMDVNPPSPLVEPSASAPALAPSVSQADASPSPLSPVHMLDPAETPRPHPRPSPRELPPLPGPSPGESATTDEYQLAAAAWSGSGSSNHGNDGDPHERERLMDISSEHEHEHEHQRHLQHDRASHMFERGLYHDGYNRHSTTPGSPPYRRYHPYPYRPPSRPRYYPFAPPYYPSTQYHEYAPYFPPSVSAPYRPSGRSSINGGSFSEMQSPMPPDVDPEGAELDGSPVATRIVSIVQDTMAKLADVLNANGSVKASGIRGERMTQRSAVASVSGSVSVDAGLSRYDTAQRRTGGGESLRLEDVLGQIRLLKEEHRCEVKKMRTEIEGLRRQVQDLQGRSTREQGTDEAIESLDADSQATEASGVAFDPIDLPGDARDTGLQVNRPISLVKEGILHRLDTQIVRDHSSPSVPLREEASVSVSEGEVDKGKEKEKVVCPPRMGPTSSNDGIPMSPSHNGLPLPIKSQRKGRMFVPIDMTDDGR